MPQVDFHKICLQCYKDTLYRHSTKNTVYQGRS